jgi:tetratricopeptide (TPR) repeat protein
MRRGSRSRTNQASILKEVPSTQRIEVLGRLIRLVGVERAEPDRALEILEQVRKIAKGEGVDEDGRKAFRKAVNTAGDVQLFAGKRASAQKLYAEAERLYPRVIPKQVRAARIGAYPNSLREYVQAGNYGAALDLVDQWEDRVATDKLNGHSFYWRGKALSLRGQAKCATRHLDRALRLARGAGWETEARWLLAEALEAAGKKDEAKKELAKLIATGLSDEFTKKAKEQLKK